MTDLTANINRLTFLYHRLSTVDLAVPVYGSIAPMKFRRAPGAAPEGPPDPYAGREYIDRMECVRAEHKELVDLIRRVNAVNASRAPGAAPVPGTTGDPIAEVALPESGKEWKDRKVEFPPKVPPFVTLERSYQEIVDLVNGAFLDGEGAGWIGRKVSIEEVIKAYKSWRENWDDMVREWVPVHAGRGELPLLLKFMKEAGPLKSRKCTLVKNDDSIPFGPDNARWTVSRMRLSSTSYPYAKAKEAYRRLEDSAMPITLRWKSFLTDFLAEVGFPPDRNGGPPVELVAKDPTKPLGKGNAVWAQRPLSLLKQDTGAYYRTRHFWVKYGGPLREEGEWPKAWDNFEVFADPDKGPGPVPPASLSKSKSQRPRWQLHRHDKDAAHGAVLFDGKQNSFWGENDTGVKLVQKRKLHMKDED